MTVRPFLGRLLVAQGALTEVQLAQALALCEREPLTLLECVVKAGFVSEAALAQALAKGLGLPFASLANKMLRPEVGAGLSRLIPEALARDRALVPLMLQGDALLVAMADPTDQRTIQALRGRTALEITVFAAPRGEILGLLQEFYRADAVAVIALPAETDDTFGLTDHLQSDGGTDGEFQEALPSAALSAAAETPLPPLGTGGRGEAAAVERDAVDCSVYAPPQARPGDRMLVQVYAHAPEKADEARAAAVEADSDAVKRGVSILGTRIARGSRLMLELVLPGLTVDEPVQALVWRGRTDAVQFEVAVPPSAAGVVIGKLLVSQDGVPIGEVKFKLTVAPGAVETRAAPAGEARRYGMAFVSYASKDRLEVLRRVQMLPAAGVRFFQDVVDLEPGDNWNDILYRRIEEADVMFLFWSGAAKDSDWVQKEWRYGLQKKGLDFIRPIMLEGPPIPVPPQELSHLHFNDKLLYFMQASAPR